MTGWQRSWLAVGWFCAAPLKLAAQAPAVVEAVRLAEGERIQLDGVLDEPVWQRVPPASGFLQQEPVEGADPSERTEVRIAYDEHALYIGVLLHDSEPSGILAYQRQRNANLATDDRFMWILDTFRDGRTAYFFEINPAGLLGDGLLSSSGVNKSWDGIWNARVARGDHGWSAEIRIPFRTLNFNPALDAWGINFQRTIRRRNEELVWSGHRRNQGLLRPVHAGLLTGLQGVSQGLGLEIKPYTTLAARQREGLDATGWDVPADLGFDLNYSLTPGLRASLSVNTDFAEVEVDQRRVNLTRFPLRFPERRDFFLEGSGVFAFAPLNGVEPYFSRRIGLVEGSAVPIRYGMRLTGQAGAYDLGLLQVRTGAADAHPAEQFSVLRVKRNLLRQSSVGAVYTRRAAAADDPSPGTPDHHTVGADLDLFTSRFLGDLNLQFQAFYVRHTDPTRDGSASARDVSAHGVRLTFPNDPWSGHVSYREFGDLFDPAVGFTPRRGFRRVQPTVHYTPRPTWLRGVRRLEFGVYYEYLADREWQLQTGRTGLSLLGVQFESGDYLGLEYDRSFERLEHAFRLHPDTTLRALIPTGEYRFGGWSVGGQTAPQRPVSAELSAWQGDFWSGQRRGAAGGLVLRPGPGVSVSAIAEHNRIELPEADFTTDLLRVGGGWHVSPRLSLSGNVQFDNVSEVVGLYSRFHWIARPGSDVFLVYAHNWLSTRDGLDTLQRGATTKLTYTHRF